MRISRKHLLGSVRELVGLLGSLGSQRGCFGSGVLGLQAVAMFEATLKQSRMPKRNSQPTVL